MNITLVVSGRLPVHNYGGTQRVIWCLGKELAGMGHKVTFICDPGSVSPFARIVERDRALPLVAQIPEDADIVHFESSAPQEMKKPYIVTCHGNGLNLTADQRKVCVYVSRNHADRHGCKTFVYNGLDWDLYDQYQPKWEMRERRGFHFLGKAAWHVKNVRGAIRVGTSVITNSEFFNGERMEILGGSRLNLKMGFRFTMTPRANFNGMVDDSRKIAVMVNSRGLIFPVLWHEPFGLAIIESLYMGSPVFGTPFGSLPELVPKEVGFLTDDSKEMISHIKSSGMDYNPRICREYASDNFNSGLMARKYLRLYEEVANGHELNVAPRPIADCCNERFQWK